MELDIYAGSNGELILEDIIKLIHENYASSPELFDLEWPNDKPHHYVIKIEMKPGGSAND